jgi:ribonuclease BN (tRNA processing enzyme)
MKVTFLGTASGIATKTRNQNAILLESGSRYLLLDGGEPLSIPLIRNGISCNLIDGMVISHMHSDHCGALPQLITTFQIQGKTTPFTVYLPSEGLEPLREFLRALYLAPPILEFPLNLCPIPEQETVSVGAFQLRFLPNHHLKIPAARMRTVSPQNRGESYSTELSCEGKRIIYSGDVGSCLDLLPFFDRPIDLLMCEMAHFNPEEFRTLTENIKPEITAFSHFHPDYDVNPGEILKDAFAGYPNRLIFAQDGTIFEL